MGMHETKMLLICLAACPFAAVAKIGEKMFDARSGSLLVEGPAQIGHDENMDASRFDDAHGVHNGANRITEVFDYVGGDHEVEFITGNSGKGLRIDAANLCIFVRVEDVGIDPLTGVEELQADRALIDRLEAIRATVSHDIGFITEGDVVEEMKVRVNPLLFAVAPPATYKALNNVVVNEDDHDILSRSMARRAFSKAHPGTGSIGTSVACGIAGTIAHAAYRGKSERGKPYSVRIGHPGGHLEVRAQLDPISNQPPMLESAILGRTARVIMDGCAYLKA